MRYVHKKRSQEFKEEVGKRNSRLTQEQVILIRSECSVGNIEQKEVAKKYMVSPSTVSDIVNRIRFRNIP